MRTNKEQLNVFKDFHDGFKAASGRRCRNVDEILGSVSLCEAEAFFVVPLDDLRAIRNSHG